MDPGNRAPFGERMMRPLHRWIWSQPQRRARKLLSFAQTEADGGRDLSRAAENTGDPRLRLLFLRHSEDEMRHAGLFRARGRALLSQHGTGRSRFEARALSPGERGLDGLEIARTSTPALLAFLHLSERAAAGRFAIYSEVLTDDPATRATFDTVLRDEEHHMTYTRRELDRIAPNGRWHLARARLVRLWKAYLRLASALAAAIGTLILLLQYFVLLPVFAWLAKRAERGERRGWQPSRAADRESLQRQY